MQGSQWQSPGAFRNRGVWFPATESPQCKPSFIPLLSQACSTTGTPVGEGGQTEELDFTSWALQGRGKDRPAGYRRDHRSGSGDGDPVRK